LSDAHGGREGRERGRKRRSRRVPINTSSGGTRAKESGVETRDGETSEREGGRRVEMRRVGRGLGG
jgi:hypothetical protein